MKTREDTVHGALTLHRVLDPDVTHVKKELARLARTSKFPGSNPCSLERADFPKLTRQPYFVCEKTNGIRVLLLCCTVHGRRVCCIVDRALSVWLLPLQAVPTAMFQGSVVDCELAFNKVEAAWQLLVFDAYVVSGVPVFSLPFSHRMAGVQRALGAYAFKNGDPVSMKVKHFFPTSMFSAYKQHEATAVGYFDVDGLILTPEHSPAVAGRHPDLFKLKTKHTVDFLVGRTGTDLQVFDPASKAHVAVARLRCGETPGSIVECVLAKEDGVWDVVCVRRDKTTANDMLTFHKTLLNMREGITHDELQTVLESTSQ